MSKNDLLIETHYLGNLAYYQKLLQADAVFLEAGEYFVKSSFRNRCYIASPNGIMTLSVPIKNGRNQRTLTKDIQISYDHPWQKQHWQSLCSSYRRSPYFEYYEDDLHPYFHQPYDFLLKFNLALHQKICELLELDLEFELVTEFEKEVVDKFDGRNHIYPSQKFGGMDWKLESVQYHQVFQNKTGFLPGLSILDLMFNEGPQTKSILLGSGG